jgi:hypothetical protein
MEPETGRRAVFVPLAQNFAKTSATLHSTVVVTSLLPKYFIGSLRIVGRDAILMRTDENHYDPFLLRLS